MNKTTISKQLIKTIVTTLVTFSILSFFLFFGLFRWTIIRINQQDLQAKADNIAQAFTQVIDGRGMMGGSNQYLRFLYESTQEDVWIIDTNKQVMTRSAQAISYQLLPVEAQNYVDALLNNESTISQAFSVALNASSITAGSLLKDKDDQLIGVVLVHAPISNNWSNVWISLALLGVSLFVGLLLALLVAYRQGKTLTQPLNNMIDFIHALADKQYPSPLPDDYNQEIFQVNQSLNDLSHLLQLSEQQQKQLDQLRKDFITSVSHELNTPITVLRGFIEAVDDGVIDHPQQIKQTMKTMHQQTILLQQLIADLLELTRLDNPAFTINKESIELTSVVNQSIATIAPLAKANQVELKVTLQTPQIILADSTRLHQLFVIFLNNALKFSPPNTTIEITQDKNQPTKILIVDQGPGISEDDLPYVFDLFYKGSPSPHGSTGLGLAIAKGIADRHGIELQLQNNKEKGLQVSIDCLNSL